MNFPWRGVLSIGLGVLDALVPGVRTVEAIAKSIPALKGKAKQDAVVEIVKQSLEISEGAIGKDLANDADVDQATRAVIDAVVSLNNAIARKSATAL